DGAVDEGQRRADALADAAAVASAGVGRLVAGDGRVDEGRRAGGGPGGQRAAAEARAGVAGDGAVGDRQRPAGGDGAAVAAGVVGDGRVGEGGGAVLGQVQGAAVGV